MNGLIWFWVLLGCVITFVIPRLFTYLARSAEPLPEAIPFFFAPLDWENVKAVFDLNAAKDELFRSPREVSRRLMQSRVGASLEFLQRMAHNAGMIERCGTSDQRDAKRARVHIDQESEAEFSEIRMMLEGAALFESDALLPENETDANELRSHASTLRSTAEEQLALADTSQEVRTRELRVLAALQAARQFRRAVWPKIARLNLLSFLLRLDQFGLLPVDPLIALWHRDSDDLLALYQRARSKAASYLSIYHEDEQILALM